MLCTPEGHPWRRSNFRIRFWRPAWDGIDLDESGAGERRPPILPTFTFHEGRYTHAYGAILSRNVGLLSLQSFGGNPVNLPFTNTRDRVTSISGNGFGALTSFGPYDNFSTKDEWSSSLSLIMGRHTLKFGGDYSRYRKNENALIGDTTGANNGIFTAFNATLPTGVAVTTNNSNVQRWANFLVGSAQTFIQGSADYTNKMLSAMRKQFGGHTEQMAHEAHGSEHR